MPEWRDPIYISNRINDCILEYISNPLNEIDKNISSITQLQWDGVLMYIGRTLFHTTDILRDPTNNNLLDGYMLNILCDIYIELCNKYNKVVSLYSYCFMLAISYDNILDWLDNNIKGSANDEVLNATRHSIVKRLNSLRENGLKNKLVGINQAVGLITVGNVEYGWSSDTIAREERARATALNELPDFERSNGHKLSQNNTQFKLENKDI